MRRAYKFLLRPTSKQAQALSEMLRDHCSLYNGALQERRDAYRHGSKTSIRYGDQSAQLKEIRAFDPQRQGRWSFSSQQATLRRLDKAFAAFFRRVKAGEKPGYPRFRGVNWFDTVEFPKDGDGCRWDCTPHDPVTRVRLHGVGHVRVHQHRPVTGRVKTISVKREGRQWYVILACDEVPAEPLPATGAVTGIDMGIAHFLTTAKGEHKPNPRHGKRTADALADAQRAVKAFPRCKRDTAHRGVVHRHGALGDVGDDQIPDRLAAQAVAVDQLHHRERPVAVCGLEAGRTADLAGVMQSPPERFVAGPRGAAGFAQHRVEVDHVLGGDLCGCSLAGAHADPDRGRHGVADHAVADPQLAQRPLDRVEAGGVVGSPVGVEQQAKLMSRSQG